MLAAAGGTLDWDGFIRGWYGVIRRVVLGEGARDDDELTDMLAKLRRAGNLVYLHPVRKRLRKRMLARIDAHLARADPGSLAARIAVLDPSERTAAADQVVHYIFAFEPGGMAAFRALALLAAHPEALARARDEATGATAGAVLPFLRATLLESLRLWPTTPVILRQTTRPTDWNGATMPEGMPIIIFTPFFHRDDALPFAHRFAPELWLSEEAGAGGGVRTAVEGAFALVPFSDGGGRCPAANFVPMIVSAFLAELVARRTPRLDPPERLRGDRPMPGLLDNFTLRFALEPAS